VELTKFVQRGLPFQATTEPEKGGIGGFALHRLSALPATKFDPFTVTVNVAPFGASVVGLRLEIRGEFGCVARIWNVAAFWLTPPPGIGFETVTAAVPGDATSDASTVIAISPVLRFTVDVRGAPFQYAVEVPDDPEMNPVPEMKSVKDWLPAVMLAGKSALIAGVGFGVPAELLEPQPEATITINASIPNAVQRKSIKPSLL
jgi:hypothetical protein